MVERQFETLKREQLRALQQQEQTQQWTTVGKAPTTGPLCNNNVKCDLISIFRSVKIKVSTVLETSYEDKRVKLWPWC